MTSLSRHLLRGGLAGAVGTTALNATTFMDMAVRGRPASTTPEQTVERITAKLGLSLSDDPERKNARESGIGALLGALAGVGTGIALGVLRAYSGRPGSAAGTVGAAFGLAMLAGNGPMTVLGVTDPRTWRGVDWAADVVPHFAYAVAATATLEAFDRRR